MTDLQIAQRVDARGLNCPMPIVKSAQAIKSLQSGDLVEVLATDKGSMKDFPAWAQTTGNAIVESDETDGVFRFVVRRK